VAFDDGNLHSRFDLSAFRSLTRSEFSAPRPATLQRALSLLRRLSQEPPLTHGFQAISVEIEGKFGFLLLEQAGEFEVIIVGPEDLASIIPASDEVIEPTSDFDPLVPRGLAGRILS